jgi:hypothetical protein
MTRPGDGWDRYGEEILEQARHEKQALELDKKKADRFPDQEWPKGRAFANQPVVAVKKEHEPSVIKNLPECIEPIKSQYYDAYRGETLLEMKEHERTRIEKYIKNMFSGKARHPVIVSTSRLSSDGSTLVSDAYHWMPIANAPLNAKLQLINRADGVANYGTITNANRHLFTHYAELPTFKD